MLSWNGWLTRLRSGKIVGDSLAWEMVEAFLNAEFTAEERHVRRVQKITQLESDPSPDAG